MKYTLSIIFTLLTAHLFAQIIDENSVQVVAYWNLGEQQTYSVTTQKLKISGSDTTSNETVSYDVDIKVIDSTETSYLLEWRYYNYSTNSKQEFLKKLMEMSENMKIVIETDEFGVFVGVKDWEKVRDYIGKTIKKLKAEFKSVEGIDKVFEQIKDSYSSKGAIETFALKEVQQFLHFHGIVYELNVEVETPVTVPNAYKQNEVLNGIWSAALEEINEEDGSFILKSVQEIDPEELTDATFEYLKFIAKSTGVPSPDKEEIGLLQNVTTTVSSILDLGWPVFSMQQKIVSAKESISTETRTIEWKE